jgi:predicted transglutaminase-like cysteine proteinase
VYTRNLLSCEDFCCELVAMLFLPLVKRCAPRYHSHMLGLGKVVIVLSVVWLLAATPVLAYDHFLFGKSERRSTRLKTFPKWNEMLARYQQEVTGSSNCNGERECFLRDWNSYLSRLKQLNLTEKLSYVNSFLNRFAYITDPSNYGMADYWAVPYEFQQKSCDCEDYAISKYMSLRALGVPADDMRIVVLKDENLDIHHAILAVYAPDGVYILDNQISQVVRDSTIRHYTPIYSINESYWWRHR